ncbi:MAG: ABC transporter permease [Saccharofermentans sp.]|nr:ABC transporter permease [Saccharofermentans sp.]
MNNIYVNLASNSIRQNRNFYFPYIASSSVMIALFFTLFSLAVDPVVKGMHGGKTLGMVLTVGIPIIATLAILFIVYMSSFIMKRRKKELGLYSVLGMEKRHIIKVIFFENLFVSVVSIISGTIIGVIVEKLAQLSLLKLLHQAADVDYSIATNVLLYTIGLFVVLFVFIFLNSVREIIFKPTLAYIKEEQAGEKKPKARWFLGFIGLVVLCCAYYMACTVKSGADAITRFALAVFLVIIATYILFIVGSIAVLELMKKNKNYYYKTNHFISVSGMTYRMKRNGAGLASICILSTMVLVMISSVSTVFFYNDKAFSDRFNFDFGISADDYMHDYSIDEGDDRVPANNEDIINEIYTAASEADVTVTDLVYYKTFDYYGFVSDRVITNNPDYTSEYYEYWVIDLETYNRINNESLVLKDNQFGYWFLGGSDDFSGEYEIEGVGVYEASKLPAKPNIMPGEYTSTSKDIVFMVIPDSLGLDKFVSKLYADWDMDYGGDVFGPSEMKSTYYAFNIDGDDDAKMAFWNKYNEKYTWPIDEDMLSEYNSNMGYGDESDGVGRYRTIFCSMLFQQVFYNMYGGLFFLGILLSICCIVIAVLIMYFKQLLEGYEDAKRFTIMKKVGLTKDEIKKSIYSQIVMVFLTPIICAGIHTAFAYRIVKSLIVLFGISNIDGYFVILLISMAVFTLFYALVFWITSQNYFKIVNAAENAV